MARNHNDLRRGNTPGLTRAVAGARLSPRNQADRVARKTPQPSALSLAEGVGEPPCPILPKK